jgi:hypothetical protein
MGYSSLLRPPSALARTSSVPKLRSAFRPRKKTVFSGFEAGALYWCGLRPEAGALWPELSPGGHWARRDRVAELGVRTSGRPVVRFYKYSWSMYMYV